MKGIRPPLPTTWEKDPDGPLKKFCNLIDRNWQHDVEKRQYFDEVIKELDHLR